jgi:hypothetical protein
VGLGREPRGWLRRSGAGLRAVLSPRVADWRARSSCLGSATTPALISGEWSSLAIPLSAFTGLTTRGNLAQMIISGDPITVYVTNVYLRR